MIKTNKKTTFLMTSIMLSAILVTGLIAPAYAVDESPTGCTENAVTQTFGITPKITAAGQIIAVLTANIGIPAGALNCDYTVTAQSVVVDVSGTQTEVLTPGDPNNCVGETLTQGNSINCTFLPSAG